MQHIFKKQNKTKQTKMFTSTIILNIKPVNGNEGDIKEFYTNHGSFHKGDSGFDVFCLEDQVVKAGETACIKLGIECEAKRHFKGASINEPTGEPILLFPRSSISKTPLTLNNSIGLIDAGYRGEIMAKVRNNNPVPIMAIEYSPYKLCLYVAMFLFTHFAMNLYPIISLLFTSSFICWIESQSNEFDYTKNDYTIKRGERLFQLVAFNGKPMEVEFTDKLSETSRGTGGFGSTNTVKQE